MGETASSEEFLYFSFGSNMNGKRLALSCPEAQAVGPALLKGYALDFWNLRGGISDTWRGAAATIVENTQCQVWGVLWRIPWHFLDALDRQEGVEQNIYKRIEVTVSLDEEIKKSVMCITYQMVYFNEAQLSGRPSPQYLTVIRHGASEMNLPAHYQQQLQTVKDNGYQGDVPIMKTLYPDGKL